MLKSLVLRTVNTLLFPILMGASLLPAQSYTLEDCVRLALGNKETVQSAALDVESARWAKRSSYSNVLPSVRLNGGWNESRFPSRSFTIDPSTGEPVISEGGISNLTTWSSGVSGSQTLYDGGNSWNRMTQASNNETLALQQERQTRINVVREVHSSFFQLLKSQQLLEVARLSLQLARQQVDLVKNQFELGAVKKTDLLKAEVREGQARVDLVQSQSDLRNRETVLRNAMGLLSADSRFTIQDRERPLLPVPEREEALVMLEEYNPSFLVSLARLRDAELNYKLTRGTQWPIVSANLSYSASSDELAKFAADVNESWRLNSSISLSLPLFTGFDVSSRIQQAQLSVRRWGNDTQTLRNDLEVNLEALREVLYTYREIIPINEEVLASAEEDLRLVQERYGLGSATILEVLDAQVSVTQARSSLVSSRYDARIQEANLRALLGTLDISDD